MNQIECDYILLIFTCKKYKNRAIKQKTGWLSWFNSQPSDKFRYYHVTAAPEICKENKFCFDHSNKLLYTNTKDDYNSLSSKVITAFLAVNQTFNFKYIFKTDDDQHLFPSKQFFFHKLINVLREKKFSYGGDLKKHNTHISSYHNVHPELPKNLLMEKTVYSSGRFYFLVNEAVKNLLTRFDEFSKRYIEDHAVGFYLHDKFKRNVLDFKTYTIFFDNDNTNKLKRNKKKILFI